MTHAIYRMNTLDDIKNDIDNLIKELKLDGLSDMEEVVNRLELVNEKIDNSI